LSSYLKSKRINTKIIDGLRDKLSESELVEQIVRERPDVVGITCLTAFYNEVVSLSKRLKKLGYKVIIGGVHPTSLPRETLEETGADWVLCGEGEIALTKFLRNDLDSKGVVGIYSLSDLKKDPFALKADVFGDLDDLPNPDWNQIDPNSYPRAPHGAITSGYPIGIVMTSRGCPYMCSFCASPFFYERKIRFRSPEKVIEEIEYLVSKFGIKEVHFEDDNLTMRRDHVEKICKLLIKNKVKVKWACPNGIRADKVDEKLLRLMKKAGCYYVAFGIESANPQILKNIHKLETIDVIEKAIKMTNRAGIQTQGFFIFGLPGETRKTIRESIDFAKGSGLCRAQFIILDVLPGSELWTTLKGEFVPNWKKDSYKEPEWIPPGLTKKELMDSQSKAFREFYFRPITMFRLVKFIRPNQVVFILKRFKDYRIFGKKDEVEGSFYQKGIVWQKVFEEIKKPEELETLLKEVFGEKIMEIGEKKVEKALEHKDLESLEKRIEADRWAEKWTQKLSIFSRR
jgi:radical SAM superfamily enzyme YgiQ (UPF0313 family)